MQDPFVYFMNFEIVCVPSARSYYHFRSSADSGLCGLRVVREYEHLLCALLL